MLEIGGNQLDNEGNLRVLKGRRGLVLFNTQTITNSNNIIKEQVFFANKLLDHKQAMLLRDYLIEQYPLDEPTEIIHKDNHHDCLGLQKYSTMIMKTWEMS